MHVILIAQSRDVTRKLQETLLSHGHSAECTEQGESGIQLLKFRSFDAILVDDELPDISGLDVVKQIRAMRIDTPVLFVSELRAHSLTDEARACGRVDFCQKPLQSHDMIRRLSRLIPSPHIASQPSA